VAAFQVPWYPDQRFRVPNLMEIQRLFRDGGYDRVMCSTEMLMGPIALFLKTAFKVPVYFYMHTDWLDFFEKNTSLDARALEGVCVLQVCNAFLGIQRAHLRSGPFGPAIRHRPSRPGGPFASPGRA